MPGPHAPATLAAAARSVWAGGGVRAFYRGWAPAALKILPQSAARFAAYDWAKAALGVARAPTDS